MESVMRVIIGVTVVIEGVMIWIAEDVYATQLEEVI